MSGDEVRDGLAQAISRAWAISPNSGSFVAADAALAHLRAAGLLREDEGLRVEGLQVCAYPQWPNCAVGSPTNICGMYLVEGQCPANPRHHGRGTLTSTHDVAATP